MPRKPSYAVRQLHRWFSPWRSLSEPDLYALACETIDEHPSVAFSLNLSDKVIIHAQKHDDPAGYLKERINRSFRKAGLEKSPFVFTFEYTGSGRLHVHGMLILQDRSPEDVHSALKAAGGALASKGRQLSLKNVNNAGGFLSYSHKTLDQTQGLLQGRVSFISQSLRRLTKDFHAEQHRLYEGKRRLKRLVREKMKA